jgi:small subunit ribosomal protein S9
VEEAEQPTPEAEADAEPEPEGGAPEQAEPVAEPEAPPSLAELAADARYIATGKRKSSVARVILKPGGGEFRLNGRSLETYFPRRTHQSIVMQPLEVAGYAGRIDVVARIHGGGVSGQADALRHGIAKALIEADPALRGELKRRQLLTRDPRVKERRKAGLKKARKRPQFSKR